MVAGNELLDENDLLRRISDGTAAETGSSFFRAVVKNLSQALGTHGAWITEYLPEVQQLRALAFWLAGDFVEHYVYHIASTACEASLKDKDRLHQIVGKLDVHPRGERSVWIPEGLIVLNTDKVKIPTTM